MSLGEKAAGTIELVERQLSPVPRETYDALGASPEFRVLSQAHVLSLAGSREVPYGIRASAFVGHALLKNALHLAVREKSPGWRSALLHWALPTHLRPVELPAPTAEGDPAIRTFVSCFLDYLNRYVDQGRVREYVLREYISPSSRGRLDVRRTMRLRARGKSAVAAYRSSELTADLLPNRLLALGISVAEGSAVLADEGVDLRYQAYLFEDVDQQSLLGATHADLADLFRQVFDDQRVAGDLRSALEYARLLVLDFGTWPGRPEGQVPYASFVNLELLFQDAVCRAISELLPDKEVSTGRVRRQPIFHTMPSHYKAEPDVVVGPNGAVELVADCKYKDLERFPAHADVYQLLAHCGAMASPQGLLIYPGSICNVSSLGETRTGVLFSRATVRPRFLREDLEVVLGQILALR